MAIKPVQILINAKDNASGVFDLIKKNAVSLGATLLGYFGVKSFFGAVQGAAELEAKLSEVKAVSGATAEEMDLMRKAAEDAGASTKYTATQSAEALANLARAGLDVRQSIETLPGVLALAQAGEIDLGEAASIVTKALAGFRLEASQAGLVADVLAKGANASNTSVLGLAQALSYAGPTASSLNLSLETTVAILGKFADGGIDASRAGTALNAILAQFSDPASKFRSELAAMGITTNDFEQALRQLGQSGPAGQKAILAVGTEAGPALRALLNQGIGALDELKTKLQDAGGSAAATAATMQNNLNGAVLGLGSVWDTVKNALATPVLPVLKDGIVQLTTALRNAVSDGTIGKFGTTIASGFQAALTWARAFLAEVDFDALSAKASGAAERVGTAFDQLAEYAKTTGNTVQLAWGVMAAGANGVLTGIYALGTAFAATASSIVKGAAIASEALAKIAISDSAKKKLLDDATAMREILAGLEGVTTEFAAKANQSLDDMSSAAQSARDGWSGLTGATEGAAQQVKASAGVFKDVAETLKEVGGASDAMGQKAKANAILQTEAARATRVEVAALKKEYEAALQAGNVQSALEKLSLMQQALRRTAEEATATGQQVANAFSNVGIKTKTELTIAAQNARSDFETIKSSGEATAEGVKQAFQRMAEAAIASGDSGQIAFARTQAAAQGMEITIDSTGKAIVRAMNSGAAAADGLAGSIKNVNRALDEQAAASARAAAAKYGSPLGDTKYSAPKGGSTVGSTREDRLAGQGASDENLRFELLKKLQTGTLSEGDLGSLKAVVATLKENERMFAALPPGLTSLEGLADDRKWESARAGFEQAIANMQGRAGETPQGAASVGRSVIHRVEFPGGKTETINVADEASSAALVRTLQQAKIAAHG
jgi:TP901 family phage tail tape measure protein